MESPIEGRSTRFIWTQKALEAWVDGKSDPAHTISAPNIAEVFDGFVRQLRSGTPWMLVDADDQIIHTGTAGMKEYV